MASYEAYGEMMYLNENVSCDREMQEKYRQIRRFMEFLRKAYWYDKLRKDLGKLDWVRVL